MQKEIAVKDGERQALVAGFGMACADIVRLHGSSVVAVDVLVASGFAFSDFAGAGLEEYDLAELRKLYAEEPALRSRH